MRARIITTVAVGLLAFGLWAPATVSAAEDTGIPERPYATALGDLDGDGAPDVGTYGQVQVPTYADVTGHRLTVRAGEDGAIAWQATFDDQIRAEALDLGDAPGVLAVEGLHSGVATGFGGGNGIFGSHVEQYGARFGSLVAYDADGTPLWTYDVEGGALGRVFPTGDADLGVGAFANFPRYEGIVTREDASDVVLVSREVSAQLGSARISQLTLQGLDAATGEVVGDTGIAGGGAMSVTPFTDIDGDGIDDLLVVHDSDPLQGVTLHSGPGIGDTIWHATAEEMPGFHRVEADHDLTGDGVPDVVVLGSDDGVIVSSGGFTDHQTTALVFDGLSGSLVLQEHANDVVVLGAPGGAPSGLLLADAHDLDNTAGVVSYTAVEGDGRVRYDVDFVAEGQDPTVALRTGVGDLDGDGVRDVAHRLSAGGQETAATLSGASGQVLGGDVDGNIIGVLAPFAEAVVGALATEGDQVRLAAIGALSDNPRWTSQPLPGVEDEVDFTTTVLELTGDGVQDVLLELDGAGMWALDGADGAVRWQH